MLNYCSTSFKTDDEKKYYNILKEVYFTNEFVLIDRFNYNKLTLDIITCKLKHFNNFCTQKKFFQMLDLLNGRKTLANTLKSSYYCSIRDFFKAYGASVIAKNCMIEEYGQQNNLVEHVSILKNKVKIALNEQKFQEAVDTASMIDLIQRQIYGENNFYLESK